jgi:hypothetical protein
MLDAAQCPARWRGTDSLHLTWRPRHEAAAFENECYYCGTRLGKCDLLELGAAKDYFWCFD